MGDENLNTKGKTLHTWVNPNFLLAISFSVALVLYSIPFSSLNTNLSLKLKFLLFGLILINFIMGISFKKYFRINTFKEMNLNSVFLNLFTVGILLLSICEGIYSKGFPIFGQVNYKDYGIPSIHVILVTVDSFYILVLCDELFNFNKNSKKIFMYICLALIPLIISLSRGSIVVLALSILFDYLFKQEKIKKRHFGRFVVLAMLLIGSLYIFGISGNYRMNKNYNYEGGLSNSSLILSIGKATNEFKNSGIPSPYFWTYSYTTSPIANLNLNVSLNNYSKNKISMNEFIMMNFVPDFIGKRLYPNDNAIYAIEKVTNEFTVGTVLATAFLMSNWIGLYLFVVVISLFPLIYCFLLKRWATDYIRFGMSVLCTVYILAVFSNFFVFTGLSLQLWFPFIVQFFKKIKFTN